MVAQSFTKQPVFDQKKRGGEKEGESTPTCINDTCS